MGTSSLFISLCSLRPHGAGMARFVCHDPRNVFDIIPCDVVASVVLLSAAALHAVNPPEIL